MSLVPLLDVSGLSKHFPIQLGLLRRTVGYVRAVDDVSFTVHTGETVGIVGESGSGKTTLGRCIARLYTITAGVVHLWVDGRPTPTEQLDRPHFNLFRRQVQVIFQDPFASLNPRMTVLENVGEPLLVNGLARGRELEARVVEILQQVGLRPEHLRRFPHSFSGGQRQRIGIARALAIHPKLIIADEAVSALDVSVQAQVLNLLKRLQAELGLTYLFISHNMGVIRYMSDRVMVMYAGQLVEVGEAQKLFTGPKHPYTEMLLQAAPRRDQRDLNMRKIAQGEPPNLAKLPSGCVFHLRCKYAQARCHTEIPAFRQLADGRSVRCHFAEELALEGVPS